MGRHAISKRGNRDAKIGSARAWQARGPGFEFPMLHLFVLNSKLAVKVSECQLLP
jgi:hypothetical protein